MGKLFRFKTDARHSSKSKSEVNFTSITHVFHSFFVHQTAKNLYIMAVKGWGSRLNRLPKASPGDFVLATVKKGKPELRKKVHLACIIRQRKQWRRSDGVMIYFEDNAGVIVNTKGEMKGSQILGPVRFFNFSHKI
jgi:ribosomal protein L14